MWDPGSQDPNFLQHWKRNRSNMKERKIYITLPLIRKVSGSPWLSCWLSYILVFCYSLLESIFLKLFYCNYSDSIFYLMVDVIDGIRQFFIPFMSLHIFLWTECYHFVYQREKIIHRLVGELLMPSFLLSGPKNSKC